jgi:hypothetical protein
MGHLQHARQDKIERASAVWFLVLSAELFCGGPYGLIVFGASVRWGIWSIAILLSAATLASRPRDAFWQCQVILWISALVATWALIVPICLRGSSALHDSLREARPLLGMAILPSAMAAIDMFTSRTLLRILSWMLMPPALLTVAAWIEANWFNFTAISDGVRSWLQIDAIGGTLMFGPIADGTYRVMWVVAILFPFAILIRSPARLSSFTFWAVIMTAAAWSSGSRVILAACAIAIAGSLWASGRRIVLATASAAAVVAFAFAFAGDGPNLRVFQWAGEFDEASPRGEQLRSLVSLFESHPIFGAGLGAVAETVRSGRAEYSYELTYVALLAKMGLAGALAVVAWAALSFSGVLLMGKQARIVAGMVAINFLIETASNPYLLNLFGMYLLVLLLSLSRAPRPLRALNRHPTAPCV